MEENTKSFAPSMQLQVAPAFCMQKKKNLFSPWQSAEIIPPNVVLSIPKYGNTKSVGNESLVVQGWDGPIFFLVDLCNVV
jgi:hypothetical protein